MKEIAPSPQSKKLKILCTDFDGTLLDHEEGGTPPPREFFDRIQKERDQGSLTWVINTGRGWDDLKYELIHKSFPVWPDWVVLVERMIYRVVDQEIVDHSEWNRQCNEIHDDLFQRTESLFQHMREHLAKTTQANLIKDTASPLGIVSKSIEEADEIAAFLDKLLIDHPELTYVRNSIWFRFSHVDYNKGTSLREIAKHVDAQPHEILAAGDHCNDLPMLDSLFAHAIVCPSNSIDAVKSKVKNHSGYIAQKKAGHGTLEGWNFLFP